MVDTLNDPTRTVPIVTEELPELREAFGVSYVVPEFPYGERGVYRPFPIGSTEASMFNQLGFSNPTAPSPDVYADQRPQTVAQALDEDLVKSLETGANVNAQQRQFNQDQERETLLGGDLARFIGNLIAPMARPEFLQPGFEGQGLYPAILGYSTARANIEKERQDQNAALLKAAAEAGGPSMLDLNASTIGLVDRITGAQQSIEAINRLKEVLSASRVSGGVPAALQALKRLGNFFGIQLDTSSKETYQQNVNKLKQAILTSGLFGREATKAEYKILEEIVGADGLFTGDPELFAKLQGLEMSFNQKLAPAMRMLDQAGVDTKTLFAPNRTLATKD